MKTVKEQLAQGYFYGNDNYWGACQHGRVTRGGNINAENMTQSLLHLLTLKFGLEEDAAKQVVEAAEFVGAYRASLSLEPYDYGEEETQASSNYIKGRLEVAEEIVRRR